jgi:outer membrane biosynthesis protein TonB
MATTTRKWAVTLWAFAAIWAAAPRTAPSQESNTHSEPSVAPLPQSCDVPATRASSLTIRIQLTADAFAHVVFDHPKPEGTVPAGVMGQSMICACVDAAGNISDGVKLLRGSGSPQLDTAAMEIGRTLAYPAGHPGCMRDTINFTAP